VVEFFYSFDSTKSGGLNQIEFTKLVSQVDRDGLINKINKQTLYDSLDSNKSGRVSIEEFLEKALGQRNVANEARIFSTFLPELTEIDKVLRQRKKADLYQFFNTSGSSVSKAIFGETAGLLGFYPGTPRYMEFLRAFQDRERPDMVSIGQVQVFSADPKPYRSNARRTERPLSDVAVSRRLCPAIQQLRLQSRTTRSRHHGRKHESNPKVDPHPKPSSSRWPETVDHSHPATDSTSKK